MIEAKGKSILWAHDTGLLPDSTRNYLSQQDDLVFDFISLDCALAWGQQGHISHMDLDKCVETTVMLKKMGRIERGKTRVFLSHLTHFNGLTYQEQVDEAAKHGIEVAYDGLEIII